MPRMTRLLGILLACTSSLAQTPSVSINEPMLHVTVRSLVFDDTVGLPSTAARYAEHAVTSRTYASEYRSQVGEVVRDALQQNGYFKASVTDPVRFKIVKRTSAQLLVDAHVIVVPCLRYSLSSISFVGTTALPATVLRQQFPISDGDVFDVSKVRRGVKAMKDLYCTKGYVNFTPIPDLTFDDREQQVSLRIDVHEGTAYRVGKLAIEGKESEPGARQRLLQAWTKYEGTYRCDPIREVLDDLHARPHLPLNQIVRTDQDNAKQVINYTITLGKPASAAAPRARQRALKP